MAALTEPFRGSPQVGGGREEVRTTLIRPFLLRLREERGDDSVRSLLASALVPYALFDGEGGWISLNVARRILQGLAQELGQAALEERGSWATHPETLGAYVRMLRVASSIEDAYKYLAAGAGESTRVGSFELVSLDLNHAELVYRPRAETEAEQQDRLLCLIRRAEIASLPRLWGMSPAKVEDDLCLAYGDTECRYRVSWSRPRGYDMLLGAALGGVVSAGLLALSKNNTATLIGSAVGVGLGSLSGRLFAHVRQERSLRALERYRIIALERGLEARGHFQPTSSDLIGTTLGGKYRILHRIGSGGIGVVYSAEHVELGSKVAIKVLRGAAAEDAAEIARLRREARIQSSIEHPNVVRTLDFDQMPDGTSYVVMELLQGMSLAQRLKSGGPVPSRIGVPIFIQVCRALSAAHQLGIVHRDLKPGNVFLCNDQNVKVLDFGMSKFGESEALTQDGYTLGTPEYMSPEQCVGAPVDSRTDLYSLGVMMYEALTGNIPIWGRSRRELLELHQRMVPKSLHDARPDLNVPSSLNDAVMFCLRKRAAERPQTAVELERVFLFLHAWFRRGCKSKGL